MTLKSALKSAIVAGMLLALMSPASLSQAGFQIVWVLVGEAATSDGSGLARAGRRLFDGGELASMSLDNIRVSRVDVAPVVTELRVGGEWCLTALDMRAFGPDRELIPEAPLSVKVRQDHRSRLRLRRSSDNICVRPSEPGDYQIRLTSLLPAPDGSTRGAQVFLRVINGAAATRQ